MAFRLREAPFDLLLRVASADPEVIRSSHASSGAAAASKAPILPGTSWPPTDVDEEYLSSLGFGYSPPGAWRNFLQGHENNYGGLENSRGYCQRVAGNVVNVNHTEIECFYSSPGQHDGSVAFWNHAAPDLSRRSEGDDHTELFSDLQENDVIKGGTPKLDRLLDALAASGDAPDLVILTSTCTTTVIGDDTQGSVEKLRRKVPLRVVNMAVTRDVKKTLFDEARARPGFFEVAKVPGAVNLVGMPRLLGWESVLGMRKEAGVAVNAWLLPEIDVRQIDRYMAAEAQILHDWPVLDAAYKDLVLDLPLTTVKPAPPVGFLGTRGWLTAVGAALGREAAFAEVWERHHARLAPTWEGLVREARAYRVGFVGEERMLQRFFATRQLMGIPLLPLVEEMGFGVDIFVIRPDAPKPTPPLLEDGSRRIRYFDSRAELADILRSGETVAFYSEIFFDRRLTRSGRNIFSLADLGRLGLDGAVAALRRMLDLCRLPFYRTYAQFMGDPFATGHGGAPGAEHGS